MTDVFLSYKREDAEKAKVFSDALSKRGLDVWWDIDLLPGDRFADEIALVLNQAVSVVVLWTVKSTTSQWVLAEAILGKQRNILLPVRLDKSEAPPLFQDIQTADLSNWNGSADSVDFLSFVEVVYSFVATRKRATYSNPRFIPRRSLGEEEARLWATVSQTEPPAAAEYRLYIERYPDGIFSDIALLRIKRIERRWTLSIRDLFGGMTATVTMLVAVFGLIAAYPTVRNVLWPDDTIKDGAGRPIVVKSEVETGGPNLVGSESSIDILVVLDDSTSMAPEQGKFGPAFSAFLMQLNSSYDDVRACITTTDFKYYGGAPVRWAEKIGAKFVDRSVVLDRSANDVQEIVLSTVEKIGAEWGSDEQAIRSVVEMVRKHGQYGCMREKGTLFVIVLSDEDERSVGGKRELSESQYVPLGELNEPENLVSIFEDTLPQKKLIWNSIIVVPGDEYCEAMQDGQESPSFFGVKYTQASRLTGGYVGSICETDYSEHFDQLLSDISRSVR